MYLKVKKYTTSDPCNIRSHLNWSFVKQHLDKLDLNACRLEIQHLLSLLNTVQETNVSVFHIDNNDKLQCSTEPNPTNTTKMVFKFLATIYQRHIVCSITKYILIKPLLDLLNTSHLMPEKKVFSFKFLNDYGKLFLNRYYCRSMVPIMTIIYYVTV